MKVGSVDANHDRFLGSGKDLFDSLVEIGLHVAVNTGVTLRDRADLLDDLVAIHVWICGDPVLPEVDARDLLAQECLPDVRAEGPDARYRPQVAAESHDHALLFDG